MFKSSGKNVLKGNVQLPESVSILVLRDSPITRVCLHISV